MWSLFKPKLALRLTYVPTPYSLTVPAYIRKNLVESGLSIYKMRFVEKGELIEVIVGIPKTSWNPSSIAGAKLKRIEFIKRR